MWRMAWLAAFSLLTGAVVGELLPWDGSRRLLAVALGGLVCAVAGFHIAGDQAQRNAARPGRPHRKRGRR